jgi:hypothetical protein
VLRLVEAEEELQGRQKVVVVGARRVCWYCLEHCERLGLLSMAARQMAEVEEGPL